MMIHRSPFTVAATTILLLGLASGQNLRTGILTPTERGTGPNGPQMPEIVEEPTPSSLPTTISGTPSTTITTMPASPSDIVIATPSQQQQQQQQQGRVRFINPRIQGLPVSYCSRYSKNKDHRGIGCGKEAATLFCRSQGLDEALSWDTLPYQSHATFSLADNSIHLADPAGDGNGRHTEFTYIVCAVKAPVVEENEEAAAGEAAEAAQQQQRQQRQAANGGGAVVSPAHPTMAGPQEIGVMDAVAVQEKGGN